jgi:uncharacterized protein involved in exopolysaccharide biosynthesis
VRKLGWRWAPTAQQLRKGKTIAFTLKNPREVSNDLMENLRTSMAAEDANFLRISLNGEERYGLAPQLNAITDQFVDIAAELKRSKLVEMRLALDSQLVIAARNLKEAETKLESFKIGTITEPTEGVPVPGGLSTTSQTVTTDFFTKKTQLEALRTDRKQIEDVLARAKGGAITVDAFQTIAAVRQAPDLVRALTEVSNLEADTRALRYRYTDEYRGIQQNLANLEILKTQTIPTLAQALIDQLKVQEADLDKRIGVAGKGLEQVPARATTETRLVRDFSAAENLFKTLQERYEEAKLSEISAIPDLKILDRATIPRSPAVTARRRSFSWPSPPVWARRGSRSAARPAGQAVPLSGAGVARARLEHPRRNPGNPEEQEGRIEAGGGFPGSRGLPNYPPQPGPLLWCGWPGAAHRLEPWRG